MSRLVNFKVKRISEGRYQCCCDDFNNISGEGSTEWEALTAARKAVSQMVGKEKECAPA